MIGCDKSVSLLSTFVLGRRETDGFSLVVTKTRRRGEGFMGDTSKNRAAFLRAGVPLRPTDYSIESLRL